MTSGPDLTQRVTRLENETESIYDILTEVQSTQRDHTRVLGRHTRRLDTIAGAITEHTRRLDGIDATLAEHTQRLDTIDATLVEHTRKLDGHDQRFDRIDGSLEEILRRLPETS